MELFKRYKSAFLNERFTWHDLLIIPLILTFLLISVGALIGYLGCAVLNAFIPKSDFLEIFLMYFTFFGIWILVLLYLALTKYNRPILKAIGNKPKGNNWGMLGLGLLTGFLQNGFCILLAMFHGDIYLYYDKFEILPLLLLLFAVFVQSSAEELTCRCFLYQRIKRGHRHPLWYVAGNAILFGLLHISNEGVTVLAIINVILCGLFYSLIVYYFDSLWFAMAAHCSWNYTQNILFGLPNSGVVSPYSFFGLEASTARNSFFYDTGFGIEGAMMASILMALSCLVVFLLGRRRQSGDTEIWD